MIISHKYKYIFIKPAKVAGTSVEINLAKHCGKEDVVTPIEEYSEQKDGDSYSHTARNHEGFGGHMKPAEVRELVGKKVWKGYFKFTVARNPWDTIVSRYWWEKKTGGMEPLAQLSNRQTVLPNVFNPKAYAFVLHELWISLKGRLKRASRDDFGFFVRDFKEGYVNADYYFDETGEPFCDFYMHFERLDKDYQSVCSRLGIPYEKLPRVKTRVRKDRRHYSEYYDEELKRIVAEKCRRQIAYFNYSFEEGGDGQRE